MSWGVLISNILISLLMPSQVQESFGMAAVEALACGVPVLASEGFPVGRMAESAGAGRIVMCDGDEFGRNTYEILSTPVLQKQMGNRGKNLANECFDISSVVPKALNHYYNILEDKPQSLDEEQGMK